MKYNALRFAIITTFPFSLWLGYRMGANVAVTMFVHSVASVIVIAIELLPGLIREFWKRQKLRK